MGVLHAEAREQHLRVAVGHVVAVAVGIEEKVGNLQHIKSPRYSGAQGTDTVAEDKIAAAVKIEVARSLNESVISPSGSFTTASGTSP